MFISLQLAQTHVQYFITHHCILHDARAFLHYHTHDTYIPYQTPDHRLIEISSSSQPQVEVSGDRRAGCSASAYALSSITSNTNIYGGIILHDII
jgi:hypothetical protein